MSIPQFDQDLIIPRGIAYRIRKHIAKCSPEEACGILAGNGNRVLRHFPIENSLHSPVRFQMSPLQLVQTMFWMDAKGLAHTAIYHSHPNGPEFPSETDIKESYYPDSAYLIWYLQGTKWRGNAFRIVNQEVQRIELKIE